MLDGTPATRYFSSDDIEWPGDDEYTSYQRRDYWVDRTGQLVQIVTTTTNPPRPTVDYAGGRAIATTRVTGVGEVNTITAPTTP